jgi:hypothetical protein
MMLLLARHDLFQANVYRDDIFVKSLGGIWSPLFLAPALALHL